MVDYATNWTVSVTVRNNAKSNIRRAVDLAIPLFPFPVTCFDSDNGTESVNDELIDWLQHKDIEQTRSRPYRKNDQATVESRNNHVVRRFAFYWRYDTEEQRDLPDRLWAKTYLLLNLFTPTRESRPVSSRGATGAGGPSTTGPAPRGHAYWNTMRPAAPTAAGATSTTPPGRASKI